MNDKARAVLRKMKTSRLFDNPKAWDRILDNFMRDNTPDVKPLGRDQSVAVLKDMNELEEGHDAFVRSLAPGVDVL